MVFRSRPAVKSLYGVSVACLGVCCKVRFGPRFRECVLSLLTVGVCAVLVMAMYVVFLVGVGVSLVRFGVSF